MDCLDVDLINDGSTFNLTSAGITESQADLNSITSEEVELGGIFSEGNVLREYKIDKHRRYNRSIDLCYSKLVEYSKHKKLLSPTNIVVQRNRIKTLSKCRYYPSDIDFRSGPPTNSRPNPKNTPLQSAGKFSITITNGTNVTETPSENKRIKRNLKRVKFEEKRESNLTARIFNFEEAMKMI